MKPETPNNLKKIEWNKTTKNGKPLDYFHFQLNYNFHLK